MTKTPLGDERQNAIADAAIHLVATRGLRGLTHRAVDAEAGLPPGSTSYYLRTRNALLTACVNRMLARDLTATSPRPGDTPLEELLAEMVIGIAQARADDLAARYELSLEARRQPDLQEAIVRGGRQLRDGLAQLLTALGIPDAADVAWPVAAMMDGLLYDRLAGAGSTMPAAAYEHAVRRTLSALLTGLATDAR
ncbi:TetR family transcriptional regulator [Kribbella voronezhensis]|uniref:TetR family transcriptional regulator n=1 Tax=Kribbella voronezhensis TaxID=2512212 RepID=A0A4V3FKI5_9ACTN|nr:TetR/AcrR family transcriptional regulator [Kribbella voronezhensis]TDU90333.1 TetR family transcriptional regulator [Kribbella voronezhensis]